MHITIPCRRNNLLLGGAVTPVILVSEGDVTLVEDDQAADRDRDLMGVAGEVGEEALVAL